MLFLLGGYVISEARGESVFKSISLPKIKSFQLVSSLISSSFEECVGVRFDDSGYISKYCYCKSPQIPDRRSYVNMMRLAKFHQRISTPSLEPKVNQRGGRSGKSHPASCHSRQISLNQGLHKPGSNFSLFPFKNSGQISLNQGLHKSGYIFPFENRNSKYFAENLI